MGVYVAGQEVSEDPKLSTEPIKAREFSSSEKVNGSVPLEVFKDEKGFDYIDEVFELGETLPETFRESVDSVNDYILEVMDEKGYEKTTEAYKATLDKIKKDLGIDKYTGLEEMVQRISKYVEMIHIAKGIKGIDISKVSRELGKLPTGEFINLVMRYVEKSGV